MNRIAVFQFIYTNYKTFLFNNLKKILLLSDTHSYIDDRIITVSAFSPIVAPSQVPWGEKAFGAYLGSDKSRWLEHDACALVASAPLPSGRRILIDQGDGDDFLAEQLKPQLFEQACGESGQALTLRMQPGYDHSYYFIASFIGEHIAHHADALR